MATSTRGKPTEAALASDLGTTLDAGGVGLDAGPVGLRTGELTGFRSSVLAIRTVMVLISVVLVAVNGSSEVELLLWGGIVVAYNAFRVIRPLEVGLRISTTLLVIEVAIHLVAIVSTDAWRSPFVFAMLTSIFIAGFSSGIGMALRIGLGVAIAITLADVATPGFDVDQARLAAQGTAEILLVGVAAGYARRVTREADQQRSLALDRLTRLADANALLYSLHRVAQVLPASLDIDEALDSTTTRIRDLFTFNNAAVLLFDESGGGWQVARAVGDAPASAISQDDLPTPARLSITTRHVVNEPDLARGPGPGLWKDSRSGLYAALPSRQAVIGVIVIESNADAAFGERDAELLAGFVEPAALAIDNARWFNRLRTVGADEERTRIARDLHDRIGQSLAYLAFELDRIVKSDAKGESVTKALGHLREDVRGVIGEVRDTLYDLRTDVSDEQDLPSTLSAFLDRVGKRSGLQTKLIIDGEGRLPPLQERELWRVAQEAVVNVEHHADAEHVTVRWWSDGRSAALVVQDDGQGFAQGRAGRMDSYGILGMRERAASIGATIEIDSEPGWGTVVRCLLVADES